MIGPATERGGLKESENAPNSIFPKINRTGFWRFGTDLVLFEELGPVVTPFQVTPHFSSVMNSKHNFGSPVPENIF